MLPFIGITARKTTDCFLPGRLHSPAGTLEARPVSQGSQFIFSSNPLSCVYEVYTSLAIGTYRALQSSSTKTIAIGSMKANVTAYIILDLFLDQKLQKIFLLPGPATYPCYILQTFYSKETSSVVFMDILKNS